MSNLASFITHYGYIGIFIILVLGIIGLPLPDEVLLTYVGYNVFLGHMSLNLSILVAILGSMIGISISYLLGQKLGIPFIKRFGPKLHIKEKNLRWAQKSFNKYGGIFLICGYFIPGIRHIAAYIAGICNYHYLRFAAFAYIGSIIWASTFIILGIILGNHWEYIAKISSHASKIIWLFILGIFFFVLWKKYRNKFK
ncbi:alkaline phosphatase [Virgibacillus pantothenticus]|uniref:DedA family protein n=1 Tax=Virgibacillus TaxID=84406 RepID=UPI00090A00AD|nr:MULTISPECIES: DedA family protein [Virgibacillus]API92161.1 hypothetical protein BKP57_10155 [Virgibacillus sp. 6R]MBS7427245.1 DedA family protein [Virgibacillus sp. 19R1-5]MBU8568652.1 DedA family protein [Virgibacillus pantothenticus]MBU8602679.1 DedA family protein [Virgibacillus pantothenticus]MBU8636783.1 DedA family protein [Virgibacillus pantothenticus]